MILISVYLKGLNTVFTCFVVANKVNHATTTFDPHNLKRKRTSDTVLEIDFMREIYTTAPQSVFKEPFFYTCIADMLATLYDHKLYTSNDGSVYTSFLTTVTDYIINNIFNDNSIIFSTINI